MLIYGSKTFAQVIRHLLTDLNIPFDGYIDDVSEGESIVGSYEKVKASFTPAKTPIALGIGYQNLEARLKIAQKLQNDGFPMPALIHPRAYVHPTAQVGMGSIVMAGAIVDLQVVLEPWCVLWPGVVVNHESTIGSNTFLSPSATVCGCTQVGSGTFVGAGAIIVDHRKVPDRSFVKAGSLYK